MPAVELYSLLLATGALGLGTLGVLATLLYSFSSPGRRWLLAVPRLVYLKLIGVIAVSSTLAALVFQFYYRVPVCELCWWQRVFLFPIDIIVITALLFRVTAVHVITGVLATIGLLFALFHYYGHFQVFVLGSTTQLPCALYGLVPGCTASPIVVFGFVTLPFMGIVAFLAIVGLSYVSHQEKSERI